MAPNRSVNNNLVALGSGAVMAVHGAVSQRAHASAAADRVSGAPVTATDFFKAIVDALGTAR